LEGLVGDGSIVSDFLPKSNNYFSVSSGEGFVDDCNGGLLFLAFNYGEGFLSLGMFSDPIKVVSPSLVVVALPDSILLIGDGCMEGGSRGWCRWGGRASAFGVGFGWFVVMGVSGL
jgi:hypothetical protein